MRKLAHTFVIFSGLFFSSPDSEQILIPFFAAGYLIDPIWGRGGIDEGEWVQSGRPWLRQSVVSSSFDFLAFCRMFPITGPGKGGINKRESSLFAWAIVKICTYLVIPLPRSVSASHNIITSLRDTSGRPNCLSPLQQAWLAVFAISEVTPHSPDSVLSFITHYI